MALPVTISGTSTGQSNYYWGPFKSSGGAFYGVFVVSATVAVFKATDPTDSFSEQDSGNHPTSITAASIWATQVSDVIHIATQASGGHSVEYHSFNMATDLWVTTNEGIDSNPDLGFDAVSIAVRDDGDVIVLYQGQSDRVKGTDYARIDYAREEGAGWTSGVAVSPTGDEVHYTGASVIKDPSSDRMHFFYKDDTNSTVYHRSLTPGNSLQSTPDAIDSTTDTLNFLLQKGTSYTSVQPKIRQAYRDSNDRISVAKFDSADTPSISTDVNVSDNTIDAANETSAHLLAVNGTTLYLVYVRASDDDLYIDSNDNDAGWGTDTLIEGSITADRISANIYTRGGDTVLAYFRSSAGGAAVYNEYVLVAGGVVFPPNSLALAGVGK